MTTRRMDLSDIPQVARLLQKSFPSNLAIYMTHAQDGIGNFLKVQQKYKSHFPELVRYVKAVNGKIIGYADFRLNSSSEAFLSYICVSELSRGQGVASSLIYNFIREHPRIKKLSLDVSKLNFNAISLYRKLGFVELEQKVWVVRCTPAPKGSIVIANLTDSIARLKQYGFTTLNINDGVKWFEAGLIGNKTINCLRLEIFNDDTVLQKIRDTFPKYDHSFLAIKKSDFNKINVDYRVIDTISQMRKNI